VQINIIKDDNSVNEKVQKSDAAISQKIALIIISRFFILKL